MIQPQVKKLSDEFVERVCSLPKGEKILECIQCGTCTASCPTSDVMDYSPREMIAALRAGRFEEALKSNTVWYCVSCYSCAVRCPAGIPITDVMYELKRFGAEKGLLHKNARSVELSKAFMKVVHRFGRNDEAGLIAEYYLHTNPLKAFTIVPFGIRLFVRGRIGLLPHKIKGLDGLRKMIAVAENE